MSFSKDDYICQLDRDFGESLEAYLIRGLFIVSQKPKTLKEYNNAIKYSRIYINVKHCKCGYSEPIMNNLNSMTQNMYK